MKASLLRIWQWAKWPLLVLVVLYVLLVIWRAFVLLGEGATQEAVDRIHASRLTWDDINGSLPPEPDPIENNATLAGVDSNGNGIRDDVEIAIYTKYQDEPKVAVAMLQYAKALQKEFTDVYNSETFIAVVQEQGRAFGCLFNSFPAEDLGERNQQVSLLENELENFVFNTESRRQWRESLNIHMSSYGLLNTEECDLLI